MRARFGPFSPSPTLSGVPLALALLTGVAGWGHWPAVRPAPAGQVIQNIGSDTMVNLAQAWAEAYETVEPTVSVEVSGGRSRLGSAALVNGTADLANSRRRIEPEGKARVATRTGQESPEFLVGFDALSVCVHHNTRPKKSVCRTCTRIDAEGSPIDRWSQLGVGPIPGARTDRILQVCR